MNLLIENVFIAFILSNLYKKKKFKIIKLPINPNFNN